MDDRLRIKELAEEDRPREKMRLKGAAALSDAELIAILIGSGSSTERPYSSRSVSSAPSITVSAGSPA